MNNYNLQESIDSKIIKIRTKTLDLSFNELYDMYKNKELIIDPEYQRLFRWEEEKQSRFIESLILEMPIPPIYVIEKEDGVYELIDGLQRISSYLNFRGEKLIKTNKGKSLKLIGCDIIKELNKFTFDDLPTAIQIKLKRSFIRVEVVKKESEPNVKYHIFKRLNNGGQLLSAQEIRNCTIRILGSSMIDFIIECSKNKDFCKVIQYMDEEKKQALYDQEIVLRFFALKNDMDSYRYPVTDYLTNYLEKITTKKIEFNMIYEKKIFNETFKYINIYLKDGIFSSQTKKGINKKDFILYLYDAISIPIAKNINNIIGRKIESKLAELIIDYKYNKKFNVYKTGSLSNIKERVNIINRDVIDEISRTTQ